MGRQWCRSAVRFAATFLPLLLPPLIVCTGCGEATEAVQQNYARVPWYDELEQEQGSSDDITPRKMVVGRRDANGAGSSSPPGTLRVSGACAKQSLLDSDFIPQGVTADNKLYYKSEDGSYYLYFDKNCDGKGSAPARWIFDSSKPNTTAASDLDGDGKCSYSGRIDAGSALPPESATWRLLCEKGWTNIQMTIVDSSRCLTNKEAYLRDGCCAGACGVSDGGYDYCFDCPTTQEQDPMNYGGPSCFRDGSCIAGEPPGSCAAPSEKQPRGTGTEYAGWCVCPEGSFCSGGGMQRNDTQTVVEPR